MPGEREFKYSPQELVKFLFDNKVVESIPIELDDFYLEKALVDPDTEPDNYFYDNRLKVIANLVMRSPEVFEEWDERKLRRVLWYQAEDEISKSKASLVTEQLGLYENSLWTEEQKAGLRQSVAYLTSFQDLLLSTKP